MARFGPHDGPPLYLTSVYEIDNNVKSSILAYFPQKLDYLFYHIIT